MGSRLWLNISVGVGALVQNKLRALLTSLGVVFGVASVIAMFAIVTGAKEEILERLRLLGAHNVIIKSIPPKVQEEKNKKQDDDRKGAQAQRLTPGLTLLDAQSIASLIPQVEYVVPEVATESSFSVGSRYVKGQLAGVSDQYFTGAQLNLSQGNGFSAQQLRDGLPVCIIGAEVRSRLFAQTEPVGQMIKCGNVWLKVIGVLESKRVSEQQRQQLQLRNYDRDVFMPITTFLLRVQNRNLVNQYAIQKFNASQNDDDKTTEKAPQPNYHQLDQLTIRVKKTSDVALVGEVVGRMLFRRHNSTQDFEVVIAEQVLQQEQKNEELFNNVLLALASISLLVGGIGIMNIMLASVVERTKEIGIRLSLGATKSDIVQQFIAEAVVMSIGGGVLGIGLGVATGFFIENYRGTPTIITWTSIVIAFGVSVAVGLVFGIFPARRAAKQDPIVSLRYE